MKSGSRKALSEAELIRVVASLRTGDPCTAMVRYLSFAVPTWSAREYSSSADLIAAYPEVCSEASVFIWTNLKHIPQSDLDAFLPTIKSMKVLTVEFSDSLYSRWSARRDVETMTETEAEQLEHNLEDVSTPKSDPFYSPR